MTTIELLDAVRARYCVSDYKAAPLLGVTRNAVSNYRTGKSKFEDAVCIRVAELLDLPPTEVLAAVAAERTKCPAAAQVWRRVSIAARSAAAALVVCILMNFAPPTTAQSHPVSHPANAGSLYIMLIMRSIGRALARWLRRSAPTMRAGLVSRSMTAAA